ncbi:MAG: GGDEF and EAL domain-containing protein [Oscillospiraceae bacterium]|nr:GGDEF and EAL domain-containing protein [Oscillospiraceae bacterium]
MEDVLNNPLFEAFANASDNVYIYVCDVKKDLSRWSPNAVSFFDLPGEYINNAGELWGEKIHPEDKDVYFNDIGAVFSGKKKHHSCQYRAVNRFGKYVWLECKGSMLKDENGELATFAGIMTRLDRQNKYDTLTGILTKYEFYEYDFSSDSGIVLLLGVDGFRSIINTYGYYYGDELLTAIAKKLQSICTGHQRAYRFNGDEFILLLPGADRESAASIFRQVRSETGFIETKDGKRIDISISAGAVEFSEACCEKDEIVSGLELTLSYVKRTNKGDIGFYSKDIEEKQLRERTLKEDLRESIANGFKGFELFFQPLVDAKGAKILGCEALLRWKGEHIKNSYPMEFIPILEESGDINPVGKWVMRQAVKQQKEWQEKFGQLRINFNVSYRQFLETDYVKELQAAVKEFGVSPDNLVLELTESCNVESPENLAKIFEEIRSLGFHIALDDFGTGYASMELLKKLPADEIKIEHSFVRELANGQHHKADLAIIDSLLFLCRKLDNKVVVEGVENKAVDDIIRGMGPDFLQGYYYSRPVCKAEFEEMLKSGIGC